MQYLFEELHGPTADYPRGLSPHYLTLYAMAVGLEAENVFEFGAGLSTRVLLDAVKITGGRLWSVAPKPPVGFTGTIDDRYWTFFNTTSDQVRYRALPFLDLVLHDGSHDQETVATDLYNILSRVKLFGMVAVHDTQHSYSGAGMRVGIQRALEKSFCRVSLTTLPYGFGLTLIRVEEADSSRPSVRLRRNKVGSEHRTHLRSWGWMQ